MILPWLCPPLAAQARDSVHALEGVVVAGRRIGAAGGASGIVVNPDSLSLRPAATVEDALRELPFVHVRQNSRGMAEISVRGSESRQVAVLLDGVPLSLAWDHRTDPSVIPLLGVRSLSLVRGLPSLLGGPNVLGGVVEVDVGRGAGREENAVRAMAGWDDAGHRAAGASATGVAGRWVARAGAGFRSRDGLALPRAVIDSAGHGGLRANSDVEQASAFGVARWEGPARSWVSLSGSAFRAERGVPPELHLAAPRLWRIPQEWQGVAALTAGSGRRRTAWGTGEVEASL
ncbi:MAG TPA: TonB-dependent receptor plug domain-containing protein, partial [Longimicrobium sp.]